MPLKVDWKQTGQVIDPLEGVDVVELHQSQQVCEKIRESKGNKGGTAWIPATI